MSSPKTFERFPRFNSSIIKTYRWLKSAAAFLQKVDADLLVTGHIPLDTGFAAPNDRQLILDSLGSPAGYALFPADKPLTLVAYECELATRAYIEPVAVGDVLPNMPLFVSPHVCFDLPLEATYQAATDAIQPPVRP